MQQRECTFSPIKRKFGGAVLSKRLTPQINEVVAKVLCHNLTVLVHAIHELGIEMPFGATRWCPRARLTEKEQANVRKAPRYFACRAGGWRPMQEALSFKKTLTNVSEGHNGVRPNLAFRLARMAGVAVDDVLNGTFPPAEACPHCGR